MPSDWLWTAASQTLINMKCTTNLDPFFRREKSFFVFHISYTLGCSMSLKLFHSKNICFLMSCLRGVRCPLLPKSRDYGQHPPWLVATAFCTINDSAHCETALPSLTNSNDNTLLFLEDYILWTYLWLSMLCVSIYALGNDSHWKCQSCLNI